MVCIGTLDTENTVDMKIGVRKRLNIIFSYGGQLCDLKAVLDPPFELWQDGQSLHYILL
jgi:propanol-preferring alcohol dehydrogenase